MHSDVVAMAHALSQGQKALDEDEVPIGAVLVNEKGEVLHRAHNQTVRHCDPSAHAEMLLLRWAMAHLTADERRRATLYVTIEPCVMCASALAKAELGCVVYGANEPRRGAIQSALQLYQTPLFQRVPTVRCGVCAESAKALMRAFFKKKR